MTQFLSTRDKNRETASYEEILLRGLSPDGGLYVPSTYPKLSKDDIVNLNDQPYWQIAAMIKQLFSGPTIGGESVPDIMQRAYGLENFPHTTSSGIVTPVRKVREGLYLQNLSLGPTAAFKDMAMQPLGLELQAALKASGGTLTILGATSGDTGSAAESAMKDLEAIRVCMLSPRAGMSDFQKAQMAQLSGTNITNIGVDGNFDDCQDLVKALKADLEFSHLGAVNSINWGRISSQVAYYFAGYLQVAKTVGDEVDFVVPTGNFGNVFAGHIARKMGLPIGKLIIATNENNVMHTLIQTGVYKVKKAVITSSPSMDISKASNFERLLYEIMGGDPGAVQNYMEQFNTTGRVEFSDFNCSNKSLIELGFDSVASSHQKRLEAIRWTYEVSGSAIDPHTADAVVAAQMFSDDGVPKICLETALSVKFETTVKEALGFVPAREPRFKDLESKVSVDSFVRVANDVSELKALLKQITAA